MFGELRAKAKGLEESIRKIKDLMGFEEKRKRLEELERLSADPLFWEDHEEARRSMREISRLKEEIGNVERIERSLKDLMELMDMAEEDIGALGDLERELKDLESGVRDMEIRLKMTEEYDPYDAIVTIHPGAGGTESQDWAEMLMRMYMRWADRKGFSVEILDIQPAEEAGLKSATFMIKGKYAYGYMKGEKGVHRLVRISPFDANHRRHTSFASVDVIPDIEDDIEVEIREEDLKIETFRASSAGGQHVNKTDSAVRITHIPTGIVVQCQNERSQHRNKAMAMKVLRARLYELARKEIEEKKRELRGERKEIAWGNQIRSYIFQPYTLVKDHRTGVEVGNINAVMDGEIDPFIESYLFSIGKRPQTVSGG
jgi:peptide chain release factor 2